MNVFDTNWVLKSKDGIHGATCMGEVLLQWQTFKELC
jgi:hypothetical protein